MKIKPIHIYILVVLAIISFYVYETSFDYITYITNCSGTFVEYKAPKPLTIEQNEFLCRDIEAGRVPSVYVIRTTKIFTEENEYE